VASIVSTSGFVTTDFDLWPTFSKGLLMLLLLTGACAGSTCGGFKIARMLLVLKSLGRNIRQVLNPRRVLVVRNNGRTVSQQVLDNTNAYLAAYVVIIVVSHLLLSMEGFSFGTTISAVLTCFNNVGPGFEAVGPTCNFSGFSDFSKLVLTLDMLAGRLEIFPILALFSKDTWLRK
jgi:trk system potassium uptake protein TrkH